MSVVRSIELELPAGAVYLAGSRVQGRVVLTLHSTLVQPVVRVELVGRGYVEWSEETGRSLDYSRDVLCNNKADYVRKAKTFPVLDNWLGAGSHTFDFSFTLPPRLPSSFSSRLGSVCYFLQASCLGREIILAKKRVYLLVQAAADSTSTPCTPPPEPPTACAEKKVSYHCCCGRGSVRLQLELERGTFRPGETLSFTAEVQNRTARPIRSVLAVLVAHVRYEGFTPAAELRSKADSCQLLRREAAGPIAPFSTGRVGAALPLPAVLSLSGPGPGEETLMSTRYELLGSVRLPWSLSSVKAAVPVVIAGSPLEACPEEETTEDKIAEACPQEEATGQKAPEACPQEEATDKIPEACPQEEATDKIPETCPQEEATDRKIPEACPQEVATDKEKIPEACLQEEAPSSNPAVAPNPVD